VSRLRAWAAFAARLAAGAALAAAGFRKLSAPWQEFAAALEAYRLFPDGALFPIARTLPWIEYLLGLYLLAGLWMRQTAPAALALFGAFVAVLGTSLARGVDLASCGCLGGGWPLPPAAVLAVDSFLVLGLVLAVLDKERLFSADRGFAAPPSPSRKPK
jgi:hypothetical protein